jgi:FkbM family methyltransferase
MKQRLLQTLRLLARPFLGRGYWSAPVLRSIAAWYQRKYRPEFVMIEGNRFYLDYSDGYFSSYVAVHGYWEKMESDLIRRYVRPGMTVLDLGANIGYYTLLFSELVGEHGRVIAFEPEPKCYQTLVKNVAGLRLKNVEVVQAAAWHETGELAFFTNESDAMDHSAIPVRGIPSTKHVRAVAIDDVAGDITCDFIKMDIQGAEGHALQGMQLLLQRHLPQAMITEFWPASLTVAGTPPRELFNLLAGMGYTIEAINEEEQRVVPVTFEEIERQARGNDAKFFNLLCTLPESSQKQ